MNEGAGSALGICSGDVAEWARVANRTQRRLLTCREVGDAGWWGTYAEMAFTVAQASPYLTCPRDVARLEYVTVCDRPVPVQNQFYSYLQFGDGRFPKTACPANRCELPQWYGRNNVATFVDVTPGNLIRVYPSSAADVGTRVLVSGTDANGQVVTSLDGPVVVQGEYVTLASPFADTLTRWNTVTGIQKDTTVGAVAFYGVNPITSAQVLLLSMQQGETTASYRRYYLGGLPINCCTGTPTPTTASVVAMAQLDLVPARVDSDYLLLQSLDAILAEAQSIRYSEIDGAGAKAQAAERHRDAVRYLQGQSIQYNGKDKPAINFAPFGSARLSRVKVGTCF